MIDVKFYVVKGKGTTRKDFILKIYVIRVILLLRVNL